MKGPAETESITIWWNEDPMQQATDAAYIDDVLRHCQVYYGVDTTKKATEKAKLGGFLDKCGNITSNGRSLALMMLSEKSKY